MTLQLLVTRSLVVSAGDRLSPEGEHKGLDACVEELDLEQPVANRRGLTDELVHPLVVSAAVAALVDVDTLGRSPGGLPSRRTLKRAGGLPAGGPITRCRSAGVELIRDRATGLVDHYGDRADSPRA